MSTTIVHNFRASAAPNPSCCSEPSVLCPKCARVALNKGDDMVHNQPIPKPEPLGLPDWDFSQPVPGLAQNQHGNIPQQQVVRSTSRFAGVAAHNCVGNQQDDRPTPLGLPVMDFSRRDP